MQVKLNDIIFNLETPWNNEYQGKDKKILFICSAGILRSATAARLYAKKYNTRAAGSESYALIPVTADLLAWADEIVFVNHENYNSVSKRFDLDSFGREIVILNIPDIYPHMHPDLIEYFKKHYKDID